MLINFSEARGGSPCRQISGGPYYYDFRRSTCLDVLMVGSFCEQVPVTRDPFFNKLDLCYIFRFRSLGAFDHIKAYGLTLREGLEPVALNRGIVYKHISAILLCEKTKTFGLVEPFDSPFCHVTAPP